MTIYILGYVNKSKNGKNYLRVPGKFIRKFDETTQTFTSAVDKPEERYFINGAELNNLEPGIKERFKAEVVSIDEENKIIKVKDLMRKVGE